MTLTQPAARRNSRRVPRLMLIASLTAMVPASASAQLAIDKLDLFLRPTVQTSGVVS
jgi:hypothetical protein